MKNKYKDMGEHLELGTASGAVFLIDKIDFDMVRHHSWCVHSSYPFAHIKGKKVWLHRFLIDVPQGMDIDHINRDPLDNRRSNLRIATRMQNSANQTKRQGCTSQYKGVSYCKERNLWRAQIKQNYKGIIIGLFNNEKEAAMAYNKKATEIFGEFANLNIV